MSISYGEKLRAIRKQEKLTQAGFSELTGVSLGAIKNYETGHTDAGLSIIERVVNCVELSKYTLWLMTDQTSPDAGQIAPEPKFLPDTDSNQRIS